MRVLVTGASGMVGRNLMEHPRSAEHQVLFPPRSELNLCDSHAVRAWLRDRRPDLVVHLAGRVGGIQANIAKPVDFLVDNWDMGRNVLLGSREAGISRLINVGSSCMYPRDWPAALEEAVVLAGPLEPTNEGYALAKISVARLAAYLSQESPALRYKTVIPCNLYGRFDAFDETRSHLVAAALAKADRAKRGGAQTVEVWGDGQARREFMFAADMADFLWEAVARFDDLPQIMNVGPGSDHCVDEYYRAALRAVGHDARLEHAPARPEGMKRKLLSTAKLAQWGWGPRTSLEDGMRATYDYFLKRDHER